MNFISFSILVRGPFVRNVFDRSEKSRFNTSMLLDRGNILRPVSVNVTLHSNINWSDHLPGYNIAPVCLLRVFEYFLRSSVRSIVFINCKFVIIIIFLQREARVKFRVSSSCSPIIDIPFLNFFIWFKLKSNNYLLEV